MNAAQRRESILKRLSGAEAPVSASALAAQLGGLPPDRGGGCGSAAGRRCADRCNAPGLSAAPGGKKAIPGILACVHSTEDEMRTELYTIVDQGGIVVDVAVENSLYGEAARQPEPCQPL